ncbi:MAG: hypothetical protein ACM31C_04570 [Acidobacteriota bacterium]
MKVLGRRNVLRTLGVLAVFVPLILWAAPVTTPNTFTAGSVVSSSQMNDNFTALTNGINAIDTRVTALEAKMSPPTAAGVFAYVGNSAANGAITKTFNSKGGTNSYAGTNGAYTVTLGGIDCGATTGTGIAIAQAAGASGISCRINGDWGNVGADCRVFVGCFDTAGNLIATPFSLIYAK